MRKYIKHLLSLQELCFAFEDVTGTGIYYVYEDCFSYKWLKTSKYSLCRVKLSDSRYEQIKKLNKDKL